MRKMWFKNRRYGYGWMPASWEGWFVFSIYAFFVLSISFSMSYFHRYTSGDWQTWSASIVIATGLLVIVARITGEKPEWRWGGKKIRRK